MADLFPAAESPLEDWTDLGRDLGLRLLVKRDDLLPFPLPGNKYRKLLAEWRARRWCRGDVLVSTGGVDSNHCRTLAWFGARLGCEVHLVLHGDATKVDPNSIAVRMLGDLGATCEIVPSAEVADRLKTFEDLARERTDRVWVVPGGAHTAAGVSAFHRAARDLLSGCEVDVVVVASGTGATQAGIILGAHDVGRVDVQGISVARSAARGAEAVRECLGWFDAEDLPVNFDDRFVDGGYARCTEATRSAVTMGWRHGLPLDTTYTGKAFNGLRHLLAAGEIPQRSRVLFWHTGGLGNYLAEST